MNIFSFKCVDFQCQIMNNIKKIEVYSYNQQVTVQFHNFCKIVVIGHCEILRFVLNNAHEGYWGIFKLKVECYGLYRVCIFKHIEH